MTNTQPLYQSCKSSVNCELCFLGLILGMLEDEPCGIFCSKLRGGATGGGARWVNAPYGLQKREKLEDFEYFHV